MFAKCIFATLMFVLGHAFPFSGPTFCTLGRRATPAPGRECHLKPSRSPPWWVVTIVLYFETSNEWSLPPLPFSCSRCLLVSMCSRYLCCTLRDSQQCNQSHVPTPKGVAVGPYRYCLRSLKSSPLRGCYFLHYSMSRLF